MRTKKTKIGHLNTRITISKEHKKVTASGQPTSLVYETVRECFAQHLSADIQEDEEGKITAVYTDSFIIRRKIDPEKDMLNSNSNIGLVLQKKGSSQYYDIYLVKSYAAETRADQHKYLELKTFLRE